jgi:hypothetical protein
MRTPVRLWRDLGAKSFLAVQVLFLGSLSQAVLAPVLWSFWALSLGLPHPLSAFAGSPWMTALWSVFLASEIISLGIAVWAVSGPMHRHLIKWVPILHFYFPLASLSSYKALFELVAKPFYWDKTAHGVIDAEAALDTSPPSRLEHIPPLLIRLEPRAERPQAAIFTTRMRWVTPPLAAAASAFSDPA